MPFSLSIGRVRRMIEWRGIESTRGAERAGRASSHFWLWSAANVSPFVISAGVLVMVLGFSWVGATVAILVGVIISYPLVGLVAITGLRGGAPALTLSRAAFGYRGNMLPTLLAYIYCIGWESVALFLAASATKALVCRIFPNANSAFLLVIGLTITGTVTFFVTLYGYQIILRAQRWITIALAFATAGYFFVALPKIWPLEAMPSAPGAPPLLAGISFVAAAGGLSWVVMGGDYSRYLPGDSKPCAVAGWTALGGGMTAVALLLFGVLIGAGRPDIVAEVAVDPLGALTLLLPTWFCVPFLVATIAALVGSGVVNLYSSGLNLLALGVKLPRPTTIIFDAVLVVLGASYLLFLSPGFFGTFESFLAILGVPLAAWCSIFLVDFYLHRGAGYTPSDIYPKEGEGSGFGYAGVFSLLLGTGLGLVFNYNPEGIIQSVLSDMLAEGILETVTSSKVGIFVSFFIGAAMYAILSKHRVLSIA